jgi:hypothetical protein
LDKKNGIFVVTAVEDKRLSSGNSRGDKYRNTSPFSKKSMETQELKK